MAEVCVSWENLPSDLLFLIAKRLDTDSDRRHFRTVCSSWRSSTVDLPIKSPALPMQLHYLLKVRNKTYMCPYTLFKTTVFRLEAPGVFPKRSWLIKVSEQTDGKFRLMNPFSSYPVRNLAPETLPRQVDLLKFQASEVCSCFFLRPNVYMELGFGDRDSLSCDKAALPSYFTSGDQDFLVIDRHSTLRFPFPKDGAAYWERVLKSRDFVDIMNHKNKIYAMERTGVARVFDESTFATLLWLYPRNHLCECGDWYFLKSCGDLYLVGKIRHRCGETFVHNDDTERDDHDELDALRERQGNGNPDIPYREFKVYKLDDTDQLDQKWIPVTDLGNRVFFISRDCSYSFWGPDFFPACEGNSIVFVDDIKFDPHHAINNDEENGEPAVLASRRVGLYNLKSRRVIQGLKGIPSYNNMFWPPPTWLMGSDDECSTSAAGMQA